MEEPSSLSNRKSWAFPTLSQGQNSVRFDARDAVGRVWNLKVSLDSRPSKASHHWRLAGACAREDLRVGDRIVLTREVDEEDGVSYEIKTAHEIFKCWAPPRHSKRT
uniref:TF-B3 domain-containing protein n=1 Tax=Salix viminalis TaxID=40686 RepID=A0A6N2KWS0_SALVM